MAEETPGSDGDRIESPEQWVQANPLVSIFGDHAKTRLVAALLAQYPEPINVSNLVEQAGLGDRHSWYRWKDDLLATGLVVVDEKATEQAGAATLYRLAHPEEDQRTEWLQKLQNWTSTFERDGSRP